MHEHWFPGTDCCLAPACPAHVTQGLLAAGPCTIFVCECVVRECGLLKVLRSVGAACRSASLQSRIQIEFTCASARAAEAMFVGFGAYIWCLRLLSSASRVTNDCTTVGVCMCICAAIVRTVGCW